MAPSPEPHAHDQQDNKRQPGPQRLQRTFIHNREGQVQHINLAEPELVHPDLFKPWQWTGLEPAQSNAQAVLRA